MTTPLANPDALVHLIEETLEEVFAALAAMQDADRAAEKPHDLKRSGDREPHEPSDQPVLLSAQSAHRSGWLAIQSDDAHAATSRSSASWNDGAVPGQVRM